MKQDIFTVGTDVVGRGTDSFTVGTRGTHNMKIAFISSEAVPFSKTGGLADVAGSLPRALKEIGHDVRLFTPKYKKTLPVDIGLPVYFYEHEGYFGSREELYQLKGVDYPDNLERFASFCRWILPFCQELNWSPDVIHCNDWQSALVIAYLKLLYKDDPFFKRTATVYSIHNLGYLGLFPKEGLLATGLGPDQFRPEALEFWGNIALSKAGLVYADVINTVSETYAREIQTPEFGHGLDGLLRSRAQDLYGIINGIDYTIWNPATDKNIPKRYSPATLSLKGENKLALQKANQLTPDINILLIGMITRLADQKGFDILAGALDRIMAFGCQLVVLGTGDEKYHKLLTQAAVRYPGQVGVNLKFDAMLAELIYAGSDLFLMPSRYEPCGLGQLISFKYGTVPLVRQTGGLADTVHEVTGKTGEGFIFSGTEPEALLAALERALNLYHHDKTAWATLQKRIMALNYSWDISAKKYVALYLKALAKLGIKAM